MKRFDRRLRGSWFAVALFAVLALCASVPVLAQPGPSATFASEPTPAGSDSLRISVLTCMPGPEIYALDGHSALRVQSAAGDSVWNYGLFSFEQPNFVYRFVKGETDYMVGAYPTSWFLPEYRDRGSRVYEQELNLTPEEKQKLLLLLRNDLKEQNRIYRYNYIKDNCATRIRDHIEQSMGGVRYTDTLHFGTYRKQMNARHDGYPWYQFGIDLALGSGLDGKISSRDEMFTPIEMMVRLDNARSEDGRPVIKSREILVDGSERSVESPTHWSLTPMTIGWLLFFGTLIAVWYGKRRGRVLKWLYALYFGVAGLGGCLIAFLVFVSIHEATSPNIIIWWLNPFQLIVPLTIWWRRTRGATTFMMYYNLVAVCAVMILWLTGAQSLNQADMPLMLSDLILALGWLITGAKVEKRVAIGKPSGRKTVRNKPTRGKVRTRKEEENNLI